MLFFNPFFFRVFALVRKGLEVILTDVVFPGCLWIVSFPTVFKTKAGQQNKSQKPYKN